MKKFLAAIAGLGLIIGVLLILSDLTEARNFYELISILSFAHLDVHDRGSNRDFGAFIVGLSLISFAIALFSALQAKSLFGWTNAAGWGLLGAMFLQTIVFHVMPPGAS